MRENAIITNPFFIMERNVRLYSSQIYIKHVAKRDGLSKEQ